MTCEGCHAAGHSPVGGVCLVVGDRLYFYVSGRSRGTNAVGLAFLRRDGFASMGAGPEEGALSTRPVRFSGKHLFVNVDNPRGELRVEILNQAGQVVAPFTAEACVPVAADRTLQMVRWKGVKDLSSLMNQPVRFRFRLKNGRLQGARQLIESHLPDWLPSLEQLVGFRETWSTLDQ